MEKPITRSPLSEEDAYSTYQYIALDNVGAAEAYLDALFDTFDALLENPGMGTIVEYANGRLQGLRFIPVFYKFRKHLVFYIPTDSGIYIVRILHSSRDVESLLFDTSNEPN